MSLLGIDVGTAGSKAVVFSSTGTILGSAYAEYDISRPKSGYAELDATVIWPRIVDVIRRAIDAASDSRQGARDPVGALAVDSMGENLVPVSFERDILGPSIMNMDARGSRYLPQLSDALSPDELYRITGNTISNQFSIVKLMWMKENQPEFFNRVDSFLPWNSFVSFMLGAEPVAEYALANRTLLFDVDRETWSQKMLDISGIDARKLPKAVPAGEVIGEVSSQVAKQTGLAAGTPIIIGSHDQPSASLGSGAIASGIAMYGMGTFHCIAPVFSGRKPAAPMLERGLNTEHHAVPDLFLTLIYNSGGSVVKWYRDTFAAGEHAAAVADGGDVYDTLFKELPDGPSSVRVIPHFASMGPPDFIDEANAAFVGMSLGTSRGEILKGIVEGNVFSLRLSLDGLEDVGISISELRPTGGGSRSDAAVQTAADILGIPCIRPAVSEASALGCAILAGVGAGIYGSIDEAVSTLIRTGATIEPDMNRHREYAESYDEYKRLRKFVVSLR